MRKIVKYIIVATILIFLSSAAEAKIKDEHIYLIPAGDVDTKIVQAIKERLPELLPASVKITIEARMALSEEAFDASRNQYDAERILADIAKKIVLDTRVDSALIITDVDLYLQTGDFVFGAANPSKAICIISVSRLRNEFYSLKPDKNLFLNRVVKESLHELGYAWGLSNCPDPSCLMHVSGNVKNIDKKKSLFCYKCKQQLRNRYIPPALKLNLPTLGK